MCSCWQVTLSETNTLPVYGHRHMLVLVSVDSDYHLNITTVTFVPDNFRHVYLLEVGVSV